MEGAEEVTIDRHRFGQGDSAKFANGESFFKAGLAAESFIFCGDVFFGNFTATGGADWQMLFPARFAVGLAVGKDIGARYLGSAINTKYSRGST